MRLFNLFLIFSIVFIGTACSYYNSSQKKMDVAEKLLTEHPDSALSILKGIHPRNSKGTSARHALLLTIAQDRNCITPAGDSLIKTAVEYYSRGTAERLKADYYAGRIYLRHGEYKKAVESLLDSEESALILKDNYFLGLIYRELTYMFNSVSDQDNERHYAKRAYDCFRTTGDSVLIKFAALDYGRSLSRDPKSIEEGRILLDSLITAASTDDALDLLIRADASRVNIGAQFLSIFFKVKGRNDLFHLMRNFTHSFPDDFFRSDTPGETEDYYCMMPLTSGVILNMIAEPYAREIHNRLNKLYLNSYHREWQIISPDFRIPDYQEFNKSEYSTAMVDDYLALRQENLMSKEKQTRQHWIFTLWVLAILTVASIATYIIKTIHNRRKQNNLIADASELRHMLKSKDQSINGLQDYLDSLYGENFRLLEELCDMFILPSKHSSEQKRIYENVQSIVNGFKMDGKRRSEIERYVNRYKGNVASKFRIDFPGLPERDYALFLYLAAGFSRQAISYFMGDNVSVIYNRKTRLKKRILAFDGINKNLYLEALKYPSSCNFDDMIDKNHSSSATTYQPANCRASVID